MTDLQILQVIVTKGDPPPPSLTFDSFFGKSRTVGSQRRDHAPWVRYQKAEHPMFTRIYPS